MVAKSIAKKSLLFRVRLTWVSAIVLIVLVFLFLKVIPFGEATYTKNYATWLKSGKGFIYNFTPAERVDEKSGSLPRLVGDPVYFSVFTPRTFSKAKVTIKYKSNLTEKTPIIEAGVLADNIVWQYELKPVQNNYLDYLDTVWNNIFEPNVNLLQLDKNYSNISDFLDDVRAGTIKDCPNGPTSCLATYNYSPEFNFRLADARESLPVDFDIPLRGAHVMLIYINEEPLRFDFNFVDLNQDKKPDPIQLILSKDKNIIATSDLLDTDGNEESGKEKIKQLSLEKRDLPPGVYKLEIKITDDVVIKNIKASLGRFVFANKVWPVSVGKKLSFFTSASYIQAKAYGPASVQNIEFDGQSFNLSEPYKQFEFASDKQSNFKNIELEKDDVIFENNGVFSFSGASLFNPLLKKVDSHFTPNKEIKYVLANYKSPDEGGIYKVATAEFNVKNAYREQGKYSFMLAIPGLKADDDFNDYLEIKEIKIEFTGRNIWQKIFGINK